MRGNRPMHIMERQSNVSSWLRVRVNFVHMLKVKMWKREFKQIIEVNKFIIIRKK